MLTNGKNDAFITLKDHKPNFQNNPKTRLINPAKNEMGRISKSILDKINKELKASLQINQWKNTNEVIQWFKNIPEKETKTFTVFDIKDFYPSITENLLKKAISFAKRKINMTNDDIKIINHARQSLLFSDDKPWVKKGGQLFDVTMGAYDGAEVCELVGTFIQHKLSQQYNKNDIGLYRDDGLGVFDTGKNGSKSERIKKKITKTFNEFDLDIVIECNKKVVDYLDVTFNLNDGTYRPYHKPDNNLQYINTQSNHPPNIIRQLPKTIEKRLSEHSSNEQIFNDAKPIYEKALKDAGYETTLTYTPPVDRPPKRRRKRNIIWFNPPFNKAVQTNIAKRFLKLIDKHFPRHHKYRKLFNRNTVKVSYSCTTNMKAIIDGHNKSILKKQDVVQPTDTCNCIIKDQCPMNGDCLAENTIYEATLTTDDENIQPKTYIGLAETTFKKRFANHKKSFNHERYKNETELSKEFWKQKHNNKNPKVTWRIVRKCKPFSRSSLRCNLCLSEKLEIAMRKNDLLNSRSELISKCRHVNKYLLSNFDSKD